MQDSPGAVALRLVPFTGYGLRRFQVPARDLERDGRRHHNSCGQRETVAVQYQDYYATLGVARDATADEIKKAFRKLARKYHPDVSKEADAEQRMKAVNEAYSVLSDAEKRAAYDRLGADHRPGEEFRPPPGWDGGFEFSRHGFSAGDAAGFSDFFAELFGRGGFAGGGDAGFAGGGRGHAFRGEDHLARIYLDIEDSFTGPTREITLRAPHFDAQGRLAMQTRTLKLRIPKGVREGQVIRLAGQGNPGAAGGASGDLLLEVHFNPHPRLSTAGRDLHCRLALAPWEAALGAIVPVALPGGATKVRIPAGARGGSQLRVRGRGLPGEPPGDLLLDLQIVLPPADTPKARELYETMARELRFDPRRET
jgi:curved DNA-binding protein